MSACRPSWTPSAGELRYVDLALDVWTHPNGEFVVLDQDEFDVLLDEHPELADAAERGRDALLALVESRRAAALDRRAADRVVRGWLLAALLGGGVAGAGVLAAGADARRRAGRRRGRLRRRSRAAVCPAAARCWRFSSARARCRASGASRKQRSPLAQAKGARRDAWQVLANGGFATLSIALGRSAAAAASSAPWPRPAPTPGRPSWACWRAASRG